MADIQELILAELRELRINFNVHALDVGKRLAILEQQMHDLCGNGQPGRVALLERAVRHLQQWRWWILGLSAGVSGAVGGVAWMLREVLK